MHTVFLLGNIFLWLATFIGMTFIVYYHFSAKWWASEAGWHIMSWTVATTVIFIYLSYASIVRDDYARLPEPKLLWFRLIIYASFCGLIAWRLSFVARAQHSKPHVPGVPPSEVPPYTSADVPLRDGDRWLDRRGTGTLSAPEYSTDGDD